jgi:hypothetical protein
LTVLWTGFETATAGGGWLWRLTCLAFRFCGWLGIIRPESVETVNGACSHGGWGAEITGWMILGFSADRLVVSLLRTVVVGMV